MPKTKKFIDKKKAVTFQLVHRSQQDSLIADEDAPQRVLLPLVKKKETDEDRRKRIEEQHKYGIYYDDDCNYLEHLKDPKDNAVEWPSHVEEDLEKLKVKFNLPPTVFASKEEEEVGMLNKAMPVAGPQLHLDPDLVAAMDEDFDYSDPENQLEDNFVELAAGVASDEEFDEFDEVNSNFDDSEGMDEVGSLNGSEKSFEKEETKSRFTEYSMSSSVIKRNDQLTLLDRMFEKFYASYDDDQIGALDGEEIEGHLPLDSERVLNQIEEFEDSRKRKPLDECPDDVAEKTKDISKRLLSDDYESDYEEFVVPAKEQYDCVTILSTYSNLYNRPKIIPEPKSNKIKISSKTGIPQDIISSNKLTEKALNKLNEENDLQSFGPKSIAAKSVISQLSTLSIRNKEETLEEKRLRKKALKEYRRERRVEKKANADAFKNEAKRQVKIELNRRNNVQGNKIL